LFRTALDDFYTAFNQLIYLMPIEETTILIYLKIFNMADDFKLVKDRNSSGVKFILDELLNLSTVGERNLHFLIYFVTKHKPSLIYHDREQ
jgi:hypothetical protein